MTSTRFEGLNLPRQFIYADHPYIDHTESDYVITPDTGTPDDPNHPGGWKVTRSIAGKLNDVAYFLGLGQCIDFVEMVTWVNPAICYNYERTSPHKDIRGA